MCAQFSKTRIGGTCACVLALGIVAPLDVARAGGYLSEVGPAPLRYQNQKASARTVRLPPLPKEDTPVSTNAPPAESAFIFTPDFLFAPVAPLISSSPPPAAVPSATVVTNLSRATEPSTPATTGDEHRADSPPGQTSANDLLDITPQMFVEYFKPAPSSTNAPGASVFVPVGFTPPAPGSAPSKAGYNSQ